MNDPASRLGGILERVAAAAVRSGRSPGDVDLVAVSKKIPAEAVRAVWEAGQVSFGESRVQEAEAKIPQLPGSLRWHLIGHLQKNKIRRSLPLFELVHSIDTSELAQAVDRVAGELGLFPRALLEVNVAGEASKFGFSPAQLDREMDALLALPRVQVEGLMTIAPYADDPEEARPHFRVLRELRDRLAERHGIPLTTLSMGMSGDFEVAVEEGATIVRVGTAIFGGRT